MKKQLFVFFIFIGLIPSLFAQKSITQDERMQWWREARFGMFIHWGLYSIPGGEWKGKKISGIGEWIMKRAQIPVNEYRALANQFNPIKFNAKDFVMVAKNAGMKYLTITAKHHDGFAMFKSNVSKYNIVDATPYGKDVIKALAEECQKQGIKICFYYSQSRDWNEPNGLDNEWDFPKERDFQKYLDEKVKPQLTELLTNYGPIGLIWFDTPMTISKEQAQSLKELVRKLQPECIISGRIGGGIEPDYASTGDNAVPATIIPGDWETPATLNDTWGFKKNDTKWKSAEDLTRLLFDIASKGGNYLLNVGPTPDGLIPDASVKILAQVGEWMKINNECIYGTMSSPFPVEFEWGNITQKPGKLYLGIFDWKKNGLEIEGLKSKVKKVYLLADQSKKSIAFEEIYDKAFDHHRLKIKLPLLAPDKVLSVVVMEIDGKPQVEESICQQANGTVYLPGVMAESMKGDKLVKLNFSSRGGGADNWMDVGTKLTWKFKVDKPGIFKVNIVTSEKGSAESPTWQGDHLVKVIVNGQELQCKIVADRKEFNNRSHYWRKIFTNGGRITFDKPGTYQLTLLPIELTEGKLGFTFREIYLTPVK
ncbi:MAG: alpha-L-fucosidase [Bacteroidetes bacterium]|nr:alpha-L-fucosidase [Bacteroidota bacterium]